MSEIYNIKDVQFYDYSKNYEQQSAHILSISAAILSFLRREANMRKTSEIYSSTFCKIPWISFKLSCRISCWEFCKITWRESSTHCAFFVHLAEIPVGDPTKWLQGNLAGNPARNFSRIPYFLAAYRKFCRKFPTDFSFFGNLPRNAAGNPVRYLERNLVNIFAKNARNHSRKSCRNSR